VLRIGSEKLSDRGIASAAKRVTPLRQQTDLPRRTIIDRMIDAFAAVTGGLDEGPLAEEEEREAAALVDEKYGTPAWTYLLL
jgi:lipoate-protein ligase A